jgi:hypothetical protein
MATIRANKGLVFRATRERSDTDVPTTTVIAVCNNGNILRRFNFHPGTRIAHSSGYKRWRKVAHGTTFDDLRTIFANAGFSISY